MPCRCPVCYAASTELAQNWKNPLSPAVDAVLVSEWLQRFLNFLEITFFQWRQSHFPTGLWKHRFHWVPKQINQSINQDFNSNNDHYPTKQQCHSCEARIDFILVAVSSQRLVGIHHRRRPAAHWAISTPWCACLLPPSGRAYQRIYRDCKRGSGHMTWW